MNIVESDNVSKKFYVRYMLSLRCKKILREELNKLETNHIILPYCAIEFPDGVGQNKLKSLQRNLRRSGLDLLSHQESMIIDKIINMIIEVIHEYDDLPNLNYSEILTKNIFESNESVLKIFTEVVGMSVIQFIVLHKIDRIKEFILYDNLSMLEVSKRLNYKTEQNLIAQFKKYTGLTPAHFKKLKEERTKIILQSKQAPIEEKSFKNKPVG